MRSSIDLTPDWTTEYQTNLSYTNTVIVTLALLMVVFASTRPHPVDPLYNLIPWLWLSVLSGAALAIGRRVHQVAVWLTFLGLWGAFSVQYLYADAQVLLPLLVSPVLIASFVLHRRYLVWVSLMAVTLVLALSIPEAEWLAAAASIALIACCGLVGYRLAGSIGALVQWAVDSQLKNYTRAEAFYAQREELRDALNKLSAAYGQITEINVALEAARHEAERANNAKSVFLSNVSHELRTPLNVVIGYTTFMLEMPEVYDGQPLPEPYHKDIHLIQSSGKYLLALINDLLDLSKIEAGRLDINPVAFDIAEVFDGVMATSVGLVKDKPIQVTPGYPQNLPYVWGDAIRVRQIILNLMSNGIKYTDTGTVTLHAHIQGDEIVIAVIDTGRGIPAHIVDKIFDRFQQVDQHSGIEGTGLGLDISQKLAHLHNTRITIDTEVGRGSTFSFRLPIATASQLEATLNRGENFANDIGKVVIFEQEDTTNWQDIYSIIVCTLDGDLRARIRTIFESEQHIVIDVTQPEQLVIMAEGTQPDLIVCDIDDPATRAQLVQVSQSRSLNMIPVIGLSEQPPTEAATDILIEKSAAISDLLEVAHQLVSSDVQPPTPSINVEKSQE